MTSIIVASIGNDFLSFGFQRSLFHNIFNHGSIDIDSDDGHDKDIDDDHHDHDSDHNDDDNDHNDHNDDDNDHNDHDNDHNDDNDHNNDHNDLDDGDHDDHDNHRTSQRRVTPSGTTNWRQHLLQGPTVKTTALVLKII